MEVQTKIGEALSAFDPRDLPAALDNFDKDSRKAAQTFKKQSHDEMANYIALMAKDAKALKVKCEKYLREREKLFNTVLVNLARTEELICKELVNVAKSLQGDVKKCLTKISSFDDDEKKLSVYDTFRKETIRTLSGSLGGYKDLMYPRDKKLEVCRKALAKLGSDAGMPKTASDIGEIFKKVLDTHKTLVKVLREKGLSV